MNTVLDRKPLLARLERRLRVEREAQQTGKSFRRNPGRGTLERLFVKPVLKTALLSTGLYGKGRNNALRLVERHVTLRFLNLPAAFDGYRILHLSDLHIDSLPELAAELGRRLREIEADICLMTGDYRGEITGSCQPAIDGMKTVLASLRCPAFGILGNHDSCEMAPALERMDVEILINEALPLHRGSAVIWLAGTDDSYDYRCDDLDAALEVVPDYAFKILLAHAPDLYERASAAGVDLYLCGHTHGGQVRLPWIGSVVENSGAPKAYTRGYWRHGDMQAYTSSGIGCSMLPIRFNCPPELVLLTLRRG